ncbi:MAG: T9SS type A sorting domain-containing protein [Bacteroidetes bacterium]|nr:T9SS type A sorting domain-containing protein [Bacteroidota bacterium]
MRNAIILVVLFISIHSKSKAAFIDIGEPVPFGCLHVCAGDFQVFKIFHIQGLAAGTVVQALLSNGNGSFTSGVTYINSTRYSLIGANGPWINGPFTFSTDVTDIYFEIQFPISQIFGKNYTIKFRASTAPFTTSNSLSLPVGCNGITISPKYVSLNSISDTTHGNNQWLGHTYLWTPTTSAPLITTALVAQQDFFSSTNYKGYFQKNSLSFDFKFFGPNGNGLIPGPVGPMIDGTSFQCLEGYSSICSVRLYRVENFPIGLYRFTLGADDGARLSIDGGNTWLIDMFTEHTYVEMNTNSNFPNGICLNGKTNLVIEYFQRVAGAEIHFQSELLTNNLPISLSPYTDSISGLPFLKVNNIYDSLTLFQFMNCDSNVVYPIQSSNKFYITNNGNFSVIVNQAGCVIDTSNCISINITGNGKTNLSELPKIEVFPNPTIDKINIDMQINLNSKYLVILKSILGEYIYQQKVYSQTSYLNTKIDLTNYPSGIYFLTIEGDSFFKVYKVEKN